MNSYIGGIHGNSSRTKLVTLPRDENASAVYELLPVPGTSTWYRYMRTTNSLRPTYGFLSSMTTPLPGTTHPRREFQVPPERGICRLVNKSKNLCVLSKPDLQQFPASRRIYLGTNTHPRLRWLLRCMSFAFHRPHCLFFIHR